MQRVIQCRLIPVKIAVIVSNVSGLAKNLVHTVAFYLEVLTNLKLAKFVCSFMVFCFTMMFSFITSHVEDHLWSEDGT